MARKVNAPGIGSGPPKTVTGDPVEKYCLSALRGDEVVGPWVRKACQRHLRDLKRQNELGLVWDWSNADHVVTFFETCLIHGEGEFSGELFILLPWQKFIIGNLYGWLKKDGTRRFRTAYIEAGKGVGKTPLVAGLALYELLMGPRGAEVFSAASQREQAGIVFKRAALMASKSPSVARRIKVGQRAISCLSTMSSFRAVSREAGTLEGQNVHLGIIDEVHVHKTSDVCDVVQDGTKGRPNAQVIEITNTGSGTHNVCWDHRRYSEQILDGMMDNEAWFAYVCALDEKDSWRNPKVWPKANPSLGVTVSKDYLVEQIKKAEGIPARERRVKRLNFCIWDDAGPEKAIDAEVWKACGGPVDRDELLGRECWGGLDLSAVHDLTALVLVFPRDDDTRILDVLPFFWLPDDGLEAKERKDRAPYRLWRDQGFLETTPGPTIDDWYVARRLEQITADFDLVKIGYDRFLMSKLTGTLRATTDWDNAKIDDLFVPHGQGFLGMMGPINELDKLLLNKRLRHGMHPVLNMCASYAVCQTDPAGNRKWAKDKAEQRIDGIVALTMAIGVWSNDLGVDRGPADQPMVAWI